MNTAMKVLLFLGALVCTVESICKEGELTALEQTILDAHNALRANHEGTEPLCYAESGADVTFISQSWADSMAEEKSMHHSSGEYGENLAYKGSSGDRVGQEQAYILASKSWYSEIEDWNFAESKANGGVTGHFTQLVWKESQQLNCGYAEFENDYNSHYVVCQYFPRGNFGRTPEYVLNVGQIAEGADMSEYEIAEGGGSGAGGVVSSAVLVVVLAVFAAVH